MSAHPTPAGSEEGELSAIFLRAAALMHDDSDYWIDGACLAIEKAAFGSLQRRALRAFADLFNPGNAGWDWYWMGAPQPKYRPEPPEAIETRERRVYALLLAAEAARTSTPGSPA